MSRGTSLVTSFQDDFSAGMFRVAARDKIPYNGAFDLQNCILDDMGKAPRRGGSVYLTDAAFDTGLTFIWSGILGGSHRTIVAGPNDIGRVDGTGVTSFGGGGFAYPVRGTELDGKLYLPGGKMLDGAVMAVAPKIADVYAAAGGRLIVCSGDQAFFSAVGDGATFDPTDYHKLPGGVTIIGAIGTRERVALFTTGGVWLISGIELDLTDADGNAQQRLDLFSGDLVLWGDAGIAPWQGGIVVPSLDGIWVMSVGGEQIQSPPPFQLISGPVAELYAEYVRVGYRPGGAVVFRNHYLLPILSGSTVVDTLVCRLDRLAWSHFTGHGGSVAAYSVKVAGAAQQPVLLGAQRDATARVTQLRYFDATAPVTDADGTAGEWQITTRDYTPGPAQLKSLTKKVRVEYVLEDPAATNPVLEAAYAVEDPQIIVGDGWGETTWGASTWTAPEAAFTDLEGAAPEDPRAEMPHEWKVRARAQRIRFRLTCSQATARAKVNSIEVFTRPSGRQ